MKIDFSKLTCFGPKIHGEKHLECEGCAMNSSEFLTEAAPHVVSFLVNEFEELLPPGTELGYTTVTILQFCPYAQDRSGFLKLIFSSTPERIEHIVQLACRDQSFGVVYYGSGHRTIIRLPVRVQNSKKYSAEVIKLVKPETD